MRMSVRRGAAAAAGFLLVGCAAMEPNLLGGRQKCWNESESRFASLMKGTLDLDLATPTLATAEGDRLTLHFAGPRVGRVDGAPVLLDPSGSVAATNGATVTLFGGLGGDESMVVCGVEERG